MSDLSKDLQELQQRFAELTRRVYRLEQELKLTTGGARVAPPPRTEAPPASAEPPPAPAPRPAPVAPQGMAPSMAEPAAAVAEEPQGAGEESLESALASRWFNRVGIFAVLIAAALLLKFAFDNEYIGPAGRVAIGLLAGIGLVFWSSRLHARGNIYFSYSITATGVGILYLSLWAAVQLYHLVPAGAGFLAMIAVTVSAAVIALKQEAQIVAAVALMGGLATPALLSTGQNRPVELFTYLLVLDAAAFWLVMLRPWRRLLSAAYLGSLVYYAGWHERFYTQDQQTIALAYATAFFVLFALVPVVKLMVPAFGSESSWARSKTFLAVAVLNPFFYFLELFAILERHEDHQNLLAWAAVLLGAFYIALMRAAPDPETPGVFPEDRRLQTWLHLGLAIGFLTLAIPLKLEGHWITMGWLVEAAILLQIGVRLDHAFLKWTAIIALALGVFRLLFLDEYVITRLVLNARFSTYLVALAVLGWIAYGIREDEGDGNPPYILTTVAFNLLALMALTLEVRDAFYRGFVTGVDAQAQDWYSFGLWRDFTYSMVWMIYGAGLLAYGFLRESATLRWQGLILIIGILVKVFVYDVSQLSTGLRGLSFLALGALLLGISYVYQKDWLQLSRRR